MVHQLTSVVTTTGRTAKIFSPVTIVTGDDVTLTVQLYKDGVAFSIPTSATVKVLLRDAWDSALTSVITASDAAIGADWTVSKVAVVIPAVETSAIVVTGDTSAILEVQIQGDDTLSWLIEGYIVRVGLVDSTAVLPGDVSVNDLYDSVAKMDARPTLGENVAAVAVDDGYEVHTQTNQLTWVLSNGKTSYEIQTNGWEITLDDITARDALTEIQPEQRVYVRSVSTLFERNTANTAWQEI